MHQKKTITKELAVRYKRASKREKKLILDEADDTCECGFKVNFIKGVPILRTLERGTIFDAWSG